MVLSKATISHRVLQAAMIPAAAAVIVVPRRQLVLILVQIGWVHLSKMQRDCILEILGPDLMTWYQFFELATGRHQCVFFWIGFGSGWRLVKLFRLGKSEDMEFQIALEQIYSLPKWLAKMSFLLHRWSMLLPCWFCGEQSGPAFFYFTSKFVPIILSFPGYIWSIYRFQVDKMRSHRRIRISSCEIGRRQKRSKSKGQIAANQKPEAGSAKKSVFPSLLVFFLKSWRVCELWIIFWKRAATIWPSTLLNTKLAEGWHCWRSREMAMMRRKLWQLTYS